MSLHSAVVLALVVLALDAAAAERLLAVMPLDVTHAKGRLDDAAQASLEDLLRDEAANTLSAAGWTVLTGENTLALLHDNGVDPAKCGEQACHLATAREINVETFVSGVVQFVDDEFVMSVRMIRTKTGRLLASERLEGTTTKELRHQFSDRARSFFVRAGLLDPPPPVAKESPPAPVPPAPEPIAETVETVAPAPAPEPAVPPSVLEPVVPAPPGPPSRVGALLLAGAGLVVFGASAWMDTQAASSLDGRLGVIDFVPLAGYGAGLALAGFGVKRAVSP